MLLASSAALGATIYKWVDEKGVTHYSDQPHESAQKLEVGTAQTYSAPAPVAPPNPQTSQPAAAQSYTVCEIFVPENDEVFFNTQTVPTRVRIEPALQAGHRLAIALDGKRVSDSFTSNEFTLNPVYRGTHSVMAVVEDVKTGQPVCQTASVTFHVRQPSNLAPNRANRPRF